MNDIIETTIRYKGYPIKVRKDIVMLPAFGTSYLNQSPHWSWTAIPRDKIGRELEAFLSDNNL